IVTAKRGAESGFWKGTPWRSVVLGCALAGGMHLTGVPARAQFNGATPKQTIQYGNAQPTPVGGLPSQSGQQFPPLPALPATPQAPPITQPLYPQLPTHPQFSQFPQTPPNLPPTNTLVQTQALQQPEPPIAKGGQPEKVPTVPTDTLPQPRSVKGPFAPG